MTHVVQCVGTSTWASTHLRVFPKLFGQHIRHLLPKLATAGEGKPNLADLSGSSGPNVLNSTPLTDWPEASLVHVVRYLRGNRSLTLPVEWQSAMPRAL